MREKMINKKYSDENDLLDSFVYDYTESIINQLKED